MTSESPPPAGGAVVIYTIGHSSHPPDHLIALLRQHNVAQVVDVRSSPYSRHAPQANREALARTLQAAGIDYSWMGDQLGGKPGGTVADYDKVRSSPAFRRAIAAVLARAEERGTAILCAEGDHRHCHRHRLIEPALVERGARVLHIQRDGSLIDEQAGPRQLSLL